MYALKAETGYRQAPDYPEHGPSEHALEQAKKLEAFAKALEEAQDILAGVDVAGELNPFIDDVIKDARIYSEWELEADA